MLVLACGRLLPPAVAQNAPASRPARVDQAATAPSAALDPAKARTPLADIAGLPAPAARSAKPLDQEPTVREACEAARDLIQEGRYEEAAARLDAVLNECPGDFYEVSYLSALAKYRLERFGEARTAAEFAASLRHEAADVQYLLGLLYKRQTQLDRAISHFRTATLAAEHEANNPRVTAAWFELGRCLAQAGYLTAAAAAYEKFDRTIWDSRPEQRESEEIKPLLAEYPLGALELRIDLLRRLDRLKDAAEVAAGAVKNQPDNPQLARLYARTLLEAGQPGPAFQFCRQRLNDAVAAEGILRLAVRAAREAQQLDAWLGELEKQVAGGGSVGPAMALARGLSKEGLYAEAARLWRALAQKQPDDAEAAWALAQALRDSGGLQDALDALAQFVRRVPPNAVLPPQGLMEWLKPFPKADQVAVFWQFFEKLADRDFAVSFSGGALAAATQTELAERLFQECLTTKPDFAPAQVVWAQMLANAYRWEDAKTHAAAAIKLAPDLAAAHFVLAQACDGLDQNEDAEKEYKAALRLAPRNVAYCLALARYYRRLESPVSSQRYFQQALTLEPANAEALEELIESYLGGGKMEVVRAYLKKAETLDLPDDMLWRIRTAARFAKNAFQPEHLEELKRQLARSPDDLLTCLKLGALLYLDRQPDEALQVVEKIRTPYPQDERELGLLAKIQMQRLAYEEAIQNLEKLRRRYPNRTEVQKTLADTYLYDFQPEKARPLYQKVLDTKLDERERYECRTRLLSTYTEFSEFQGALALLDEWIKQEPALDWTWIKIQTLLAANRAQEAFDLATARLDAQPDDPERREQFVRVCKEARQLKKGEERVRGWLAQQPGDVRIIPLLMEILLADQQAEEALQLVSGLQSKSASGEFLLRGWRVRCLGVGKRYDDAVEELDRMLEEPVVRQSPGNRSVVREQLISILMDAERYDEALQRCKHWLTQAGQGDAYGRMETLRFKRAVLLAAGRSAEAAPVTEMLLETRPHDPGYNNDLGYEWVEQGKNLERATHMIREAVAEAPMQAAFLDSLGWAYYKAGDFNAARKQIARSLRLRGGQSPVVFDHLGDAEYRLGDQSAARQAWQKAVELFETPESRAGTAERTKGLAAVRAKLAALERSETPKVAPTADGK